MTWTSTNDSPPALIIWEAVNDTGQEVNAIAAYVSTIVTVAAPVVSVNEFERD